MAANRAFPGQHIPTPGPYKPWDETRFAYWDRIMDYQNLVEEDAKSMGWKLMAGGLWRSPRYEDDPAKKADE